ncbi:MAG: hypothetical protein WCB92_33765 [Mycobacterium sp.]
MTTPQPDHQRPTGHWPDEDAAMDTFAVGSPRWLVVRLFGRNPLIRISDRVEALVLVLTVAVSLLAAPIAAAVGTALYDSRSRLYAEQAQTQHMVTATVIDSPARSDTITVRARWFAAGAEHTGAVKAAPTVKPGDSIDIWVDKDGSHVGAAVMSAADEAIVVALAIWSSVAIAAAALFAGTRAYLDGVRHAGWQRDSEHLIGDGDGHTSR